MTRLNIIPGLNEGVLVEYRDAASGSMRRLHLRSNFSIEGTFLTEEVDERFLVSVRVIVGDYLAGPYTYEDPSKSLQVGEVVQVPFGSNNQIRAGKIIEVDVPAPGDTPIKLVRAAAGDWESLS